MRSRYDLMQLSTQRSTKDTYFPDVMTFPIQKFKFTDVPLEYFLTSKDIDRPDLLMYRYYNRAEYDDIIFWLNGISNIFDTSAGTKIFLPSRKDLEQFFLRNRV